MTVQNSTYRADYIGNGSTTSFTVPFYFLDVSHLVVLITDLSGNATAMTLNSDYTVTGAGVSTGGTVLMTVAPASGYGVSVLRQVPFTQLSHFVANDPLPATTLEQTFDQITMQTQQLKEQSSRSIVLPANVAGPTQFPLPVEGAVLGWASGAWAWLSGASVALGINLLTAAAGMGTSLVNYLAPYTGAVGRLLRAKLADTVSVADFGADPTGVADSYAAFVLAFAASKHVDVPPGIFNLSQMVRLPNNANCSLYGVPGATFLKATGTNACIGGTTAGDGLDVALHGITFTASSPGVATGIYGPSTIEMAWWKVTNCTFSGKLRYGINANIISSVFEKSSFCLYEQASATITQHLLMTGINTPSDLPINIVTFRNCEFAWSKGCAYGAEFDYGAKILFDNCIFEQNQNTTSLIWFNGVVMPVIKDCWFEHNAGVSTIKCSGYLSTDNFVLRVEGCSINLGGAGLYPTGYFINWDTTAYKNLIWTGNLFSLAGSIPITNNLPATNFLMAGGNFGGKLGSTSSVQDPSDPFTFAQGIRSWTAYNAAVPLGPTPVTVTTLPTTGTGTYMVSCVYQLGAASALSAFMIVQVDGATAKAALTSNGSQLVISVAAGNAIQVVLSGVGATSPVTTTVTRVA